MILKECKMPSFLSISNSHRKGDKFQASWSICYRNSVLTMLMMMMLTMMMMMLMMKMMMKMMMKKVVSYDMA